MSINPIITFKAGICDVDASVQPLKIKAKPTPGYLYLYEEDELIHFCWRPRSASMSSPELELVMVPSDGHFIPYKDEGKSTESTIKSPTNGRIFVLKFQSSKQRHFFWMQAKSQHPQGDLSWFSVRDLKLGSIVDRLLQGDEVNAREEFENVRGEDGGAGGEDAEMEDVTPDAPGDTTQGGSNKEGTDGPSGLRGGGAGDGQSANMPADAAAAVQNFLRSMQGNQAMQGSQSALQGQLYTTLPDLLTPSTTIPILETASPSLIDNLLGHVPPTVLLLGQQAENERSSADPSPETVRAAIDAMSLDQKKEILRKVLRSPQFTQSLSSLTTALRDGGLPTISDALKIPVENGGFVRNGQVPLGGGDAVEAFVEGVKSTVKKGEDHDADKMDAS